MMRIPVALLLLPLLTACCFTLDRAAEASVSSPRLQIINESGRQVELSWLADVSAEEDVLMGHPRIAEGGILEVEALADHSFLVQEVLPPQNNSNLPVLQFRVVEEQQPTTVTITSNWTLGFSAQRSKNEEQALRRMEECPNDARTLYQCLHTQLTDQIEQTRSEIQHQSQLRKSHGAQWEDHACEDQELKTTPSIRDEVWHHDRDHSYQVHILHQHAASQIHWVEEFIDPEECTAAMEASEGDLRRAKVHDGEGGQHYSSYRRAWQASISVDWELEAKGDPIARLSRRVYDYTSHVLGGLKIETNGQENLMLIQYFGKGLNNQTAEDPADRYKPHCDGACNGKPHKRGSRMATMIMYCQVPTIGGHTNFRNAGVHVQPTVGSAVFFSYIDPSTGLTDDGFTSHSGCPVYEGSKKIITQWIRLGVDADNPFHRFDLLGNRKESNSEDGEEDEEEDEDEDEEDYLESIDGKEEDEDWGGEEEDDEWDGIEEDAEEEEEETDEWCEYDSDDYDDDFIDLMMGF